MIPLKLPHILYIQQVLNFYPFLFIGISDSEIILPTVDHIMMLLLYKSIINQFTFDSMVFDNTYNE